MPDKVPIAKDKIILARPSAATAATKPKVKKHTKKPYKKGKL